MKAVILLAGMGRRISKDIPHKHKALIEVYKKPLLGYLVEALLKAGITEIVPVLGYKSGSVKKYLINNYGKKIKITPVYNKIYSHTNNLYSLYSAKKHLINKSFLIVNGDLALDARIVKNVLKRKNISEIVIDDTKFFHIDSPGTLIVGKRILDLGRHINPNKNCGYAVGVYKIDSKLSTDFLKVSKEVLRKDINAGFHDPLRLLFRKRKIMSCSTKGLLWSDIDSITDLEKIRYIIGKCYLKKKVVAK